MTGDALTYAAKIDQAVTWILEGQSEVLIKQTIEETWPEQSATGLIQQANEEIARRGGWELSAARHVYQKAMEIGDFAQASRSIKDIERLKKATKPPDAPKTQLIDPKRATRDCNTLNRALRNGWEIPDDILVELPEILAEVARTGDARSRIAAARVLVSMQGQNQKTKPAPVKRIKHIHTMKPITEDDFEEHKRRLSARIAGISHDTGGPASGTATH